MSIHRRRSPATLLRAGIIGLIAVVGALSLLLGACGGGGGSGAPANTIEAEGLPDYYPADYRQLVDAAKAEGGELLVYSSTDEANWAPVLRDFRAKYPFVKGVTTLNLDSDEIFQRQLSEQATGRAPADILVSNSVQAWTNFLEQGDFLLPYESPELAQLPAELASPLPNLYSMSVDPQVLGYNTAMIPDNPQSWQSLAALIQDDPGQFDNAVGVRDISSSFAFTVFYNLLRQKPQLWDSFGTILPAARPEMSSGSLSEKVLAGEYAAAAFVTAGAAVPIVNQSGGLFEITSPTDGTVLLSRAAGITATAPHPATSKLFVDFLLSADGQQAVLEGGLSSYREGTTPVEGSLSYQDVVEQAGEDAIISVPFTKIGDADVAAFTQRWNSLRG